MKKYIFALALCLTATSVFAQPRLVDNKVKLKSGLSFNLKLPEGYEIIPALEGLKRVRFFAKSPDGRIFVTDMHDLTDNKRGTVYILDGWNAETGKFVRAIPYLTNLRNPNSCQFYRDANGQDWFYLAETHQLTRRKFTHGENEPTDKKPEVLATFPDYGLSYKYGGWHLTRTITFSPAGKMYVSVGSSCNACIEKEKVRASVIEMNPDGSGQREFARGLRNAVGLKWFGDELFATNQGSDHLGLQKPDETFYSLKRGTDYGWPFCHSSNGKIFADPKFRRSSRCRGVPRPYAYFPARSSALGFQFFDEADALFGIKNAFLVSLHGSTNKDIGHGYKIAIMQKGKLLRDAVTGFLQKGTVYGRPCDIIKLEGDSFLFTDDNKGVVYLIRKKGTTPDIAISLPVPAENTAAPDNKPETTNTCFGVFMIVASMIVRSIV